MLNKKIFRNVYSKLLAVLTIIAFLLLPGCGGGDNGTTDAGNGSNDGGSTGGTPDNGAPPNDTTPPSPTGTEGDHQFYYSGGLVYAINPGDPTNPIAVAPGRRSGYMVYQGNYDSTTHTVDSLKPHSAVWLANAPNSNNAFRFDGILYKASAQRPFDGANVVSSGSFTYENPTTKRSSDFCGMKLVVDWANPENSQLFFWLAGSNLNCNSYIESDDTIQMVLLSYNETTPPINVPSSYLGPLRDSDTGAIAGWIVHQGSSYYLSNATFEFDLSSKIQGASGWNQLLASAPSGDFFILKQTGSEITIEKYSMSSNADLGPVFTQTRDLSNTVYLYRWINDGTNLYFFMNDTANGLTLYRLPLIATGLNDAQIIAHEPSGNIRLFTVSDNSIFYEWEDTSASPTTVTLKVVAKTTTSDTPGQAIDTPDTVTQYDKTAIPGLFYNYIGADQTYYASVIGENGNFIARYDDAAWKGSIRHQVNIYGQDQSPYGILVSNIAQGGGFGGASVSLYDAQSLQPTVALGALGGDVSDFQNVSSFSNDVLANVNAGTTMSNSDLLLFNVTNAESIQRLTNTPDTNEAVFDLAD